MKKITLALALLLSASCSQMPAVEVEGGGEHPFPAYIVKLDKDAIAKEKTGDANFSGASAQVLGNQFIYFLESGTDLRLQAESLIKTLEGSLERTKQSEAIDPTDDGAEFIADLETDLSEAQQELQQIEKVVHQDRFIDCESGFILKARRMEGDEVKRTAGKPEEPEWVRRLCSEAKISPGF